MSQRADCSAILCFVQITGNVVIAVNEKRTLPEVVWRSPFPVIILPNNEFSFKKLLKFTKATREKALWQGVIGRN